MRSGPEGHSAYFKYEEGVPVPVEITKAEYEARKGKSAQVDKDAGNRLTVELELARANVQEGLSDKELSERLAGEEPERGTREHEVWRAEAGEWRSKLRTARNKREWAKRLCRKVVPNGGSKYVECWFPPASLASGRIH